ncbi:MAG TPA: biotin transporter BioY [Terriglobales bacterium]|nr:biotin transporter BioY [Terriglobales bacterium]
MPLSLSNFGVLLVGLLLGSRTGFAAALLFLLEGSFGLPVFSNGSLGLFGPTGGYLMAYPLVAFLAGWISERGVRNFLRNALACLSAEILLFAAGTSWLMLMFHVPVAKAADWGIYPFLLAELAKIAAASGIAARLRARAN